LDTSYLELLESERFGPTRLLSEQVAKLEQERFAVYKMPSKLSGSSVEFFCTHLREEYENGKN
jgi:hypothetical protein